MNTIAKIDRPLMVRVASTSDFQTGIRGPNRTELVSITGTCKTCMAQARDVYDGLHQRHEAVERPQSPKPDAPKAKG